VLSALARGTGWPADLIGYSMGGRIALHFAAAFPDKVSRLVLESASPGLAEPGERSDRRITDEQLAIRLESEGIESFVEYWEARPLFDSRARVASEASSVQRQVRARNDPLSLAAALRGLGTGSLPSLWDRLPEIRAPVLLVVGELDVKFVEVAERMVSAMLDARLVIVPGAGHTVHLERPDVWVTEVGSFLSGS
jgi:2-succinyl-6-hydroxy-2,4-cyclohexadiene-1-carboxylate synthase